MTSDQMFEKISNENIDLEKGKALIVNYEYDNRTGMCKIIDFKQATPENSILNDNKSMYELMGREKELSYTYTVKCDFAKKKDWTKTCDGVYSCGGLISDCLKAGGCATICQNKLVYTPNTQVFYVDGNFSSNPTSIY